MTATTAATIAAAVAAARRAVGGACAASSTATADATDGDESPPPRSAATSPTTPVSLSPPRAALDCGGAGIGRVARNVPTPVHVCRAGRTERRVVLDQHDRLAKTTCHPYRVTAAARRWAVRCGAAAVTKPRIRRRRRPRSTALAWYGSSGRCRRVVIFLACPKRVCVCARARECVFGR